MSGHVEYAGSRRFECILHRIYRITYTRNISTTTLNATWNIVWIKSWNFLKTTSKSSQIDVQYPRKFSLSYNVHNSSSSKIFLNSWIEFWEKYQVSKVSSKVSLLNIKSKRRLQIIQNIAYGIFNSLWDINIRSEFCCRHRNLESREENRSRNA